MLNISEELRSFKPIDIEAMEQAEIRISANERNSFELYNKALENLRAGSEDIAIIELKKAVSLNKNFNEAMNLLGICYYIAKEFSLSAKTFKAVIDSEKNGITAEKYLNSIKEAEECGDSIVSNDTSCTKSIYEKITEYLKNFFDPTMESKVIVGIAAGIITGVLLTSLAGFVWSMLRNSGYLAASVPSGYISVQEADTLRGRIAELEAEIDGLRGRIGEPGAEGQKTNTGNAVLPAILEAEKMFSSQNEEGAADKMYMLRYEQLNEESRKKYDILAKDIFRKAAEKVFQQAFNLYSEKKFVEASGKFNKCVIYTSMYDAPSEFVANAYYLLGKSYRESGDNENSINSFKKLVELFPSSQYAGYARDRLAELQAQP